MAELGPEGGFPDRRNAGNDRFESGNGDLPENLIFADEGRPAVPPDAWQPEDRSVPPVEVKRFEDPEAVAGQVPYSETLVPPEIPKAPKTDEDPTQQA